MEDQDKQVMQLLQSQSDVAPTTPTASQAEAETPPMGAPMSTPEPKEGEKAAAKINVQMAMELLQQSLPAFGSDSEEGRAIMKIVKDISKQFGEREAKTKELIPAEIIQMMQTLPQATCDPTSDASSTRRATCNANFRSMTWTCSNPVAHLLSVLLWITRRTMDRSPTRLAFLKWAV